MAAACSPVTLYPYTVFNFVTSINFSCTPTYPVGLYTTSPLNPLASLIISANARTEIPFPGPTFTTSRWHFGNICSNAPTKSFTSTKSRTCVPSPHTSTVGKFSTTARTNFPINAPVTWAVSTEKSSYSPNIVAGITYVPFSLYWSLYTQIPFNSSRFVNAYEYTLP